MSDKPTVIDVTFDGPPGPNAGRFVDVHTPDGASIGIGEWREHPDQPGWWNLRIRVEDFAHELPIELRVYRRGIDPMPEGTYQQNEDGTYSPAKPYKPPSLWELFKRMFR